MSEFLGPDVYDPPVPVGGHTTGIYNSGPTIYYPPVAPPSPSPARDPRSVTGMNDSLLQGGRIMSIQSLSNPGGGAGGGAGGVDFGLIAQAIQKQFDARNRADMARYRKLLGLAKRFGAAQLADEKQATAQEMAAANQSLTSRGLGNSTVVQGVQGSIRDRSRRRRLGIQEAKTGMLSNVISQHQNEGPDLSMLASLLMRPGAAAGGAQLLRSFMGG